MIAFGSMHDHTYATKCHKRFWHDYNKKYAITLLLFNSHKNGRIPVQK